MWASGAAPQPGGLPLTALMRRVQRFVRLDEQEAVGAADGDGQVLVDLC